VLGYGVDADVNEARKDGATPLIAAAHEANLDMVHCLVKKLGADVNKQQCTMERHL
jgi:ankyrin repeat protein